MDKSAIKNFAIEARKMLMKSAETEAGFYGVTKDECKSPIQRGSDFEVYETIAGTENRIYGADIKKRANLVKAVEKLGFEQVIEETAYTWFNRIIAIRFMEVNDYLPTRVRVLSSETGSNTPDIVTQSLDVDLNMTPEELEKVQKAKDENRYDDAFRLLFIKQCNELNAILPGLFEKTDDYMELLLKLSYTSDGVVRMLIDTIDENNFNVETEGQVEIIGWMYQYYNTELKDDTFAKLKKNVKITKERIPAATQLFTPDWIVRYMVENSVGRVWIEHLRAVDPYVDEKEKAEEFGWKYYLPEAEQEEEVQAQLVEVRKSYVNLEPKDINCIDPCMGSGHILVYMFDVLMDIYRSEGFSERDAVFSILENNIRGLDIDRRAYQLSYFALMMKARGYNRTFFRGKQDEEGNRNIVEPLVLAIDESNNVNREQLKYFGANLDEKEKNNALNQINGLLDELVDAKEYGSILDITCYDWNLMRTFLNEYDIDGQISFDTFGIDETKEILIKLMKQGKLMVDKYWAVATNPPYMGSNSFASEMQQYVKKNYPDSKNDLFAVFIERTINMLKCSGFVSLITQQGWMFLGSYEKLRKKFIENETVAFLHLGARAFNEISGEVVQTVAYIARKTIICNKKSIFSRLIDGNNESEKENLYLQHTHDFSVKISDFKIIPGIIFAYWLKKRDILHLKNDKKIADYGVSKQGLITSDNERFLRLWFEIDWNKLNSKWFPYNKGGGYKKWYGLNDYVVNWENDGFEIKHLVDEKGKLKSRPQNMQFYFKKAISWCDISTNIFSGRYVSDKFIFDASGPSLFVNDEKLFLYLCGLLNSKVAQRYLDVICQGLHYSTGHIPQVPVIISQEYFDDINMLVKKCIEVTKSDWDEDEHSWDFKSPSFFMKNNQSNLVEELVNYKKNITKQRIDSLKACEEKINDIFLTIYDLQEEENCSVDLSTISIKMKSEKEIVVDLISYAVGCMFGRYSLSEEGLCYAGGNWNGSKYAVFLPDEDGIMPITDVGYFDDDIVSRFVEFICVLYGEEKLEDNLTYIVNVLGTKGSTVREKIRNYFISDFYKDHCNMYSVTGSGKRPIYWMFDSGKENGFKCLIYMHRYNKDTLNLIRSEYLRKTEDAVENALKNAEYIIQTSASAVERAKATKDRDRYVKQLNEMKIYYQALSHLALQKIEIDLDDGVKHNYQLFQGVEVIVDGGKKQKVNLLAKI